MLSAQQKWASLSLYNCVNAPEEHKSSSLLPKIKDEQYLIYGLILNILGKNNLGVSPLYEASNQAGAHKA